MMDYYFKSHKFKEELFRDFLLINFDKYTHSNLYAVANRKNINYAQMPFKTVKISINEFKQTKELKIKEI